ncbi:hypothetical protein [Tenacibaculum ovolyticum]|uniref:hypothetical protein n=1 Tax=Tenacibaculum ovolyticum TaxID=104270 RepID=UPI000A7D7B31|nr:hypothetical protein [Tenacibaculum ovolyticum]
MENTKDTFGIEIQGLHLSVTKEEKIESLNAHISIIRSLSKECVLDLKKRIKEIQ